MPNQELLSELLSKGEFDKAIPLLQEYLAEDLSLEDKGRMRMLVASTYMDLTTKMNHQESDAIKQALEILRELDQKEGNFDDEVGLSQARAVLK